LGEAGGWGGVARLARRRAKRAKLTRRNIRSWKDQIPCKGGGGGVLREKGGGTDAVGSFFGLTGRRVVPELQQKECQNSSGERADRKGDSRGGGSKKAGKF